MMMHGYGIGAETGYGMLLGWVGPLVLLVFAVVAIAALVKYLRN